MANLSVNINKIATLRNARGGNVPDVLKVAADVQEFGAHGVTVHPRPDQRHITYEDTRLLRPVVYSEYNIEGNPIPEFVSLVLEVKPEQVTLVPDAEDAITSNAGWDTRKHQSFLQDIIGTFKEAGIRTSIFLDPDPKMVETAAACGTDRIELYTESYARSFENGQRDVAVENFRLTALEAHKRGLQINAGHDLNLKNIGFFKKNVPYLAEVSIGHALISEALYIGLENVIGMYLQKLQ